MKTDRRTFIKRVNWALAGIITTLGYNSCGKESDSPAGVYTVKGAVTNKATGKPIKGIQVGYSSGNQGPQLMYGTIPMPYTPKSHVFTDSMGGFKLTDRFSAEELNLIDDAPMLPVWVNDVDVEENGLFQSEFFQVDFSNAQRSRNEYTVNMDVELTEIEN